ncbi:MULTISPECIES: peptide ABC transporter permease [Metallosphaera]|uniref:peptide ABC transporter permease n=1 Tax=Metallosphaera TaxID=41980 RepID=UPI001F053205|nr:peptide ABC transporter permease [Metallosphaera sedula]MCH1770239.1 peptide ABC transporter permease [Metallosphaera sedula]MCP6727927.1 peptide ABC transporter permease [Metallosphaera sedula]BBL47492.1 oligopeptide transport system permease protein OppC [Metallosphaera sedula]
MKWALIAFLAYFGWALLFTFLQLPRGSPLLPPSQEYPLGTYVNGANMINVNARAVVDTLLFGIMVSLIEVGLGVSYGMLAGSSCGTVRSIMMRISDGITSLPRVPILMAIIILFATPEVTFVKANFFLTALVVGLTGWSVISRQVSEAVCKGNPLSRIPEISLTQRVRSSSEIAKALSKRFFLPSVVDGIAVYTALGVIAGVGDPNFPTLTTLLNSSRLFDFWWLFLPPAGFRAILLVLIFLISDTVVR